MAQTYSDKPTLEAWNALAEGGAKIAYGTYTGDGTYGEENPTTLTFDFEPKLIIIQNASGSSLYPPHLIEIRATFLFVHGLSQFLLDELKQVVPLTWNGTTVSWYNGNSAVYQANQTNHTYVYFAVG